MKTPKTSAAAFLRGSILCLLAAAPLTQAAPIFWTGPNTNYTQASDTSAADSIVAGVSIKRQYQEYLYNPAAGESSPGANSPTDTEWATATAGTMANFATVTNLTYVNFSTWASGPPYTLSGSHTFDRILNIPAVLHLKNENIYISIEFTYWGSIHQGKTTADVEYTRSTPAVVLPTPTVSLTNPVAGTVFAAPANLHLGASAAVSGGTVTNVQFFANAISQGSVTAAPFNLTSGSLSAGPYSLTAVATAAGISATSAVVNVSVVNPVTVSMGALARPSTTNFQFSYAANIGLNYIVQRSTNVLSATWLTLKTNQAAANPVIFVDTNAAGNLEFYRVGRLPNP